MVATSLATLPRSREITCLRPDDQQRRRQPLGLRQVDFVGRLAAAAQVASQPPPAPGPSTVAPTVFCASSAPGDNQESAPTDTAEAWCLFPTAMTTCRGRPVATAGSADARAALAGVSLPCAPTTIAPGVVLVLRRNS